MTWQDISEEGFQKQLLQNFKKSEYKATSEVWVPHALFCSISISWRFLLDFHPLVRGGDAFNFRAPM